MGEVPSTRLPVEELVALLRAFGAPEEDIERAEADGTLVLLALDRLALGQEQLYDIAVASEHIGLPEDEVRHLWRSLGFPDPPEGEKVFTQVDVDNLTAVARLMQSGVAPPEITYGMTRVVGSSMARVASALVDAVSARAEDALRATSDGDDVTALEPLASEAGGFLPMFPSVLEQVWRRHLQVAARRRLLRAEGGEDDNGLVVGFADLVGFTALSQQVSDEELARVVDQFEQLAFDVVVAGGGRVLKMIGDEVMFVVEDPTAAVEIALGLADASREAEQLSDVRVGLALGPVLEREGDAYGPTVNLASRITSIAYPGSVVVSPDLRAALEDDEGLVFKGMRPRYLKHIGRVTLSRVRHADGGPSTIRELMEDRRQQVREAVKDRLAARLAGGEDSP